MSEFLYRQLAKAAGLEQVSPGQSIAVKVDLALAHDGSGPEILKCFANRKKHHSGCSRVVLTLDHCFPAPTVEDRDFQHRVSDFAREHSVRLFKNGEGVLHQVVAEEESLWPGMIIIGADGHVATAGAFGGIAFSVSAAAFTLAVCEGVHTITVPEQLVIALQGRCKPYVMARDLAMHILSCHGEVIKGKAVVLTGDGTHGLNVSEKMSVCNFLPEGGAATVLVLPQGERKDVDITIDAGQIEPLLFEPGGSGAYVRPESCSSVKITAAIAGGCSSGRLDDMKTIADVLARSEVHPDVTFVITPASRNVMEAMDKLGISSTLRKSGAIIMPPGCGPCPGKHFGLLSERDTAISTTIRNTPGRIGAKEAKLYLASPLTVALSAVGGKITAPH